MHRAKRWTDSVFSDDLDVLKKQIEIGNALRLHRVATNRRQKYLARVSAELGVQFGADGNSIEIRIGFLDTFDDEDPQALFVVENAEFFPPTLEDLPSCLLICKLQAQERRNTRILDNEIAGP